MTALASVEACKVHVSITFSPVAAKVHDFPEIVPTTVVKVDIGEVSSPKLGEHI